MRFAKNKNTFVIIVLITLLLGYLAAFGFQHLGSEFKGAEGMRFGIDIRGGIDAAFKPKELDRAPTGDEMEAARAVIESRLDGQNILDREVTVDKTNGYVFVRFPWKSTETEFDPGKAIEELGSMAHLTFRDPDGTVVLEGNQISHASAKMDSSKIPVSYYVELTLKQEGIQAWSEATSRLIGQAISIYMDEDEVSSPTVQSAITDGNCVITGLESFDYAKTLASQINSGALPFALYADTYNAISPTLGSNALDVMLLAGAIAFLLICLGLILYYRLSGVIAVVSLILQIGGLILIMSALQITVTLAGIAGIILSVGMGVDANIINAERIRDELRSGKNIEAAVSSGFERAFSAIFDGNITVAIAAVIMMFLGSGSLLSFAYTMLFGLVMNFVGGVTATRLMTQSLTQYAGFRKTTMFLSQKAMQKELKIRPFCSRKKIVFLLTGVLLVAGLAVSFATPPQLNIQFTGGSITTYTFSGADISTDDAADIASEALNGRPVNAQVTEDYLNQAKSLVFTLADTGTLNNEDLQVLTAALQEAYPEQGISSEPTSNNVEPFFGQRFLRNGIWALVLSLLTMIIYVWFRFRKIEGLAAGVVAVLALLLNVAFVFFACVAFKMPIGESFIAVVLTTLGNSINNTIVVYDRVRENVGRNSKMDPEELADVSVTQSLMRCVNTSVAILISMAAVYVLAASNRLDSITSFALPMTVATIVGCFTSIFFAVPIWAWWEKRQAQKRQLKKAKA